MLLLEVGVCNPRSNATGTSQNVLFVYDVVVGLIILLEVRSIVIMVNKLSGKNQVGGLVPLTKLLYLGRMD